MLLGEGDVLAREIGSQTILSTAYVTLSPQKELLNNMIATSAEQNAGLIMPVLPCPDAVVTPTRTEPATTDLLTFEMPVDIDITAATTNIVTISTASSQLLPTHPCLDALALARVFNPHISAEDVNI